MSDFVLQNVRVRKQHITTSDDIADIEFIDRKEVVLGSLSFLDGITVFNYELSQNEQLWRYRFDILLGVRAVKKSDKQKDKNSEQELHSALFEISALLAVTYDHQEEIDVNQHNFHTEHGLSPIEHAWPYWMEIVAGSCQRSGFSPPIAPPRNIPKLEIGVEANS